MHRTIDTLYRNVRINSDAAKAVLRNDALALLRNSIAVAQGNNDVQRRDSDWFRLEIDGRMTDGYVTAVVAGSDVVHVLILCSAVEQYGEDPYRCKRILFVLVDLQADSVDVRQRTTVDIYSTVSDPWQEALSSLLS